MTNTLKLVNCLKSLGDSTRFNIIKLLASSGNKLCVNVIHNKLKVTQPVVSQHLRVLKNTGIVTCQKMGNHIHYSIDLKKLDFIIKEISGLMNIGSQDCVKQNCVLLNDCKDDNPKN
jgi:ArsR family transcriptional regulator